eukprot:gene7230-7996_t
MKVIPICFEQFDQLRQLHKSFLLVWYPSWKRREQSEFFHFLQVTCAAVAEAKAKAKAEALLLPPDLPLFCLTVKGSCEAEDYAVDVLTVMDLPVVTGYRSGELQFLLSHSDVATALPALAPSLFQTSSSSSSCCSQPFQETTDHLLSVLFNPLLSSEVPPMKVFISGDRSSVGKSSISWALLAALLEHYQIPESALAYIKPATQCEAVQPVSLYCESKGIAHQGIGPLVFYQGFTRAFLRGETDSRESILNQIISSVKSIGEGRRLVVVDGVGYPAVGSIATLSNADVAQAMSLPVLLVSKSGVGDAVDSYNLNAVFFEYHGVQVLGGIFNKVEREGFYRLEAVQEAVLSYFEQFRPQQIPYGFIPKMDELGDGGDVLAKSTAWMEHFLRHMDVPRLLHDIWWHNLMQQGELEVNSKEHKVQANGITTPVVSSSTPSIPQSSTFRAYPPSSNTSSSSSRRETPRMPTISSILSARPPRVIPVAVSPLIPPSITTASTSSTSRKRSREELEEEARAGGSRSGG